MEPADPRDETVSRRGVLLAGLAAAGGSVAVGNRSAAQEAHPNVAVAVNGPPASAPTMTTHGNMMTVGEVDNQANGFDPVAMLTDWDVGTTEILPDGRTLRTFQVDAEDKEIEIAPGVFSLPGHSTAVSPAPHFARKKATGSALYSGISDRTRILCTFTVSTPRGWTA